MGSDERHAWRLRLLFSIDLVDSTPFKRQPAGRQPDEVAPWAVWFKGFYDEFPRCLAEQYDHLPAPTARLCPATPRPPDVWKYSGDEVLLEVVLRDFRAAFAHVVAVRQAVMEFSDWWQANQRGKTRFPMDLKATAWLAGFPVTNIEIEPRAGDQRATPRDFVGPQIDLGFRLAPLATRRRMVVDILLAHMLCTACDGLELFPKDCGSLQYGGRQELKGLLQHAGYPLIWVDVPDERTASEEALQPPPHPCRLDDLRKFLDQYIDTTDGARRPFIDGDAGGTYAFDAERHRDLEDQRQALIKGEGERSETALDDQELASEGDRVSPDHTHVEKPAAGDRQT